MYYQAQGWIQDLLFYRGGWGVGSRSSFPDRMSWQAPPQKKVIPFCGGRGGGGSIINKQQILEYLNFLKSDF